VAWQLCVKTFSQAYRPSLGKRHQVLFDQAGGRARIRSLQVDPLALAQGLERVVGKRRTCDERISLTDNGEATRIRGTAGES